ncbi:RNA 2',3'-cyclic phosphodiesterase [Meiothermus luteus]|jgi:2'-5' RNA ligase|uniref:RNA 2',3'-cyclic phosphodiesterase n=1 Tax=Meiothermus luteus TaxID=2026184 RepID=A0A399F2A8_9DEIN|nr:RNA 2',3'-cyclic phosphodiesterase [Meiothermus luteus]RIH88751.1 RNA 2',3'-cyclic phosphodiesterase [Meiothermus luteus]RMH54470.1 MAG: RNA 2',3'-cyclic phosphodiesterase [Deinococcota bacterium]
MRLFYALFPPLAVQQNLAQIQERLRPYRGWRPVQPRQMHITLLFLGEQPEDRLPELHRAGKEVAARVPAFEVTLGGTGYFPAAGPPRVWFVKASGAGLEPLASGLRQALGVEEDSFHPHLTLARKKGPAPRVGPVVVNLHFTARAVCLVESKLEPAGAKYRVLEEFPLNGSGYG